MFLVQNHHHHHHHHHHLNHLFKILALLKVFRTRAEVFGWQPFRPILSNVWSGEGFLENPHHPTVTSHQLPSHPMDDPKQCLLLTCHAETLKCWRSWGPWWPVGHALPPVWILFLTFCTWCCHVWIRSWTNWIQLISIDFHTQSQTIFQIPLQFEQPAAGHSRPQRSPGCRHSTCHPTRPSTARACWATAATASGFLWSLRRSWRYFGILSQAVDDLFGACSWQSCSRILIGGRLKSW